MRHRLWRLRISGIALLGMAVASATTVSGQTFKQYKTPTRGSEPVGIASGPDGALWFTEDSNKANKIGRASTSGAMSEFPVSIPDSFPYGITAGPDGALWFALNNTDNPTTIGRVTTAGAMTAFSTSSQGGAPGFVAAGSDGALWFTEVAGDRIGRVTTSGATSEYSLPTAGSNPVAIAAGPDGALWFTERSNNRIGRVTTQGVITEFTVPTEKSEPAGIAAGPDGALWFTEAVADKIGRVTTSGAFAEFPIPTKSSEPAFITAGPDGALWFTEYAGNKIGRIAISGGITEFSIPTADSKPMGIATGPDGAIWFTEYAAGKIGRLGPISTAPTFQTVYRLGGPPDGRLPISGVVSDSAGNILGATRSGGATAHCPANSFGNVHDGLPLAGCGVLFELKPGVPWKETLRYEFTGGADGAYPSGAVALQNGVLFGGAEYGGVANTTTCKTGCGVVFEYDPANGMEQTVHAFTGGADSGGAYNGVAFDANGVLYSDVEGGDAADPTHDLVYELQPPPAGPSNWTFVPLDPNGGFGDSEIRSPLVVDKNGVLYGVAQTGDGVLFKLTPPSYTEDDIYTFTGGSDGSSVGGLTVAYDKTGATLLYGVARKGGAGKAGTLFAFDTGSNALTPLYQFTGGADGSYPYGPVTFDAAGAFYGTAIAGGTLAGCPAVGPFPAGCGTVFKFDPVAMKFQTIHTFKGGAGGARPLGIRFGTTGALYGATLAGGDLTDCPEVKSFPAGCGTVYVISGLP